MRETWLRSNRRILWLGMLFPAAGLAIGSWMLWQKSPTWQIGLAVVGLSVIGIAVLSWQIAVPRLAGDCGELLIYLSRPSISVARRICRMFFSWQRVRPTGDAAGGGAGANLVLRMAERAVEYQEREVAAVFGSWSRGYITFHGVWCEPLNLELVTKLNAKLSAARQVGQSTESTQI